MVVDDERGIRELIYDFLTIEGYLVTTAEDGISALVKLQDDSYDLLITDLEMPNMGGEELLDWVGDNNPNITTLIITGYPIEDMGKYAQHRGAFACIPKPFQLNHLSYMVEEGLSRASLGTGPK